MCKKLFSDALNKNMDCPIRIFPKCHPKAHVEVFVDGRTHKITLCCGACDRPISDIKIKPSNIK